MPLEAIYVVRHGFRSAWSVDHKTGEYTATVRSPTGIAADPPLTSYGVRQAEEMARHLVTLDPPIDAVYSSPYYRCLQTIAPFVEMSGPATATIRPEQGIAEWFGSAPFDHPRPATADVLSPMFPAYDLDYVSAQTPSKKGETLAQLYDRVSSAVRAVVQRSEAEGHRAIVLCTHAAVVIALGRILTGDIPDSPDVDDFQAYTCGLSVYRRKDDTEDSGTATTPGPGDWICTINSDCSFLTNGPERGWKFSGDESFPGTGSMSQDADAKL